MSNQEINIFLKQHKKDLLQKKRALHQQFVHLLSLCNFSTEDAIHKAIINYEIALINEIDVLGMSENHAEACTFLLEDMILSVLSKNLYGFYNSFEIFVKESQDIKYPYKLRVAIVSVVIMLAGIALLALPLLLLPPLGLAFWLTITAISCLTFLTAAITNYFLINKLYHPIFESKKAAKELAEVIKTDNLGFHPTFFGQEIILKQPINPIYTEHLENEAPYTPSEYSEDDRIAKL